MHINKYNANWTDAQKDLQKNLALKKICYEAVACIKVFLYWKEMHVIGLEKLSEKNAKNLADLAQFFIRITEQWMVIKSYIKILSARISLCFFLREGGSWRLRRL